MEPTFAGTGNRAAAIFLDLALVAVLAFAAKEAGISEKIAFLVLGFLYFAGMPLSPLHGTLGKWIFRIRLCRSSGEPLGWGASALRAGATLVWLAMPAYLSRTDLFGAASGDILAAFTLLFFLPWAPAFVLPRRASLFDLLSGSVVVRARADAAAVAAATPAPRRARVWLKGVGAVLVCLLAGAFLSVSFSAMRDTDRRGRIAYAIEQTRPVRVKMEEYFRREGRWPAAAAIGVAEWSPYPAGGGYRIEPDGSVVISFSVLPELKGHRITLRPKPAATGAKVEWLCSADPGLNPGYLRASCRS